MAVREALARAARAGSPCRRPRRRARASPSVCARPTRTRLASRVPHDVAQQLARRREDQLLLRVACPSRAGRAAGRGPRGVAACWAMERSGRLEPRLLEHVRVQVEDRLAQLADASPRGRRRRGRAPGGSASSPASWSSCRAESRFWIAWSCSASASALALALLGLQRVREQARALLARAGRRARVRRAEQEREQDAGEPDPGQVAGLREDEARRLGLRRRRVGDRLHDVRGRRDERRGAR